MRDIVILLDNGHGHNTEGKRSPKWSDGVQLFEWKNNRHIVSAIANELDKLGIKYRILVPEDWDVGLTERATIANGYARLFGAENTLLL